jgi:hypothetical protein
VSGSVVSFDAGDEARAAVPGVAVINESAIATQVRVMTNAARADQINTRNTLTRDTDEIAAAEKQNAASGERAPRRPAGEPDARRLCENTTQLAWAGRQNGVKL